ncbi:PRADC1-like protein [Ischnura elegans]|uniref:PRADC1-like protein n=1 Tax=Ischnura elegans TaxID=197161 RepID=UPI001ED88830|nr:PRADC1-like protein [Ischnura elegans]
MECQFVRKQFIFQKGMKRFRHGCRLYLLFAIVFLLSLALVYVDSVATNLHTFDGVATSDIVGSDIYFEIVEPEEISYTYRIRPARDFGVPFNSSFCVNNIPLVLVEPPNGCTWPHNAEDIQGNVALIERGECSFLSKTIQAEAVGARAVIITDQDTENDEFYIEMIDDNTHRDVNIPAGFLLGKNGYVIRKTLEKLNRNYALINLPINLSFVPLYKMNQPPWLGW